MVRLARDEQVSGHGLPDELGLGGLLVVVDLHEGRQIDLIRQVALLHERLLDP